MPSVNFLAYSVSSATHLISISSLIIPLPVHFAIEMKCFTVLQCSNPCEYMFITHVYVYLYLYSLYTWGTYQVPVHIQPWPPSCLLSFSEAAANNMLICCFICSICSICLADCFADCFADCLNVCAVSSNC